MSIGFVGSIAYVFKDELSEVAEQYGVDIAKILRTPIDQLIAYYKNH